LVKAGRLRGVRLVTGLDAHYDAAAGLTWGAAVTLSLPSLAVVERAVCSWPTRFPYVPGLLSFREAPVLLDALARLEARPDVLMVDGQGLAHPRRFGLACHVGVLAGIPAIGVAKSRLIGEHGDPGVERGSWARLKDGGETIGAVLRTRRAVRPIYVSIGHRVSLAAATRLVLRCCTRYRLPEPIRAADRLSREHRGAPG
jgi:deoxyribonuclease V